MTQQYISIEYTKGYRITIYEWGFAFIVDRTNKTFQKSKKEMVKNHVLHQRLCAGCQSNKYPWMLELDHIIPCMFFGPHTVNNLQWLCPACHKQKTSVDRKCLNDLRRKRVFGGGRTTYWSKLQKETLHETYCVFFKNYPDGGRP